jgi:hypothetical protein
VRGREPLVVWSLLAVVAVEVLVTYTRLPAEELYHVTGNGFEAGLSRVLVYLNFPVALIGLAIVSVSFVRLSRRARTVAAAGALLCTPVFYPGVVSQAHLDARWVNVIAGVGVYLCVLVTATTTPAPSDPHGDRLRLVVAVVALVVALPWLAADLGFSFPGPSIHHGHHHGMDGVLFVLSALLLSRQATAFGARAYLALMFAYGVGNIANDFWLEQVVRRGWVKWQVPSVLEPRPTWAWLVLVVATAAITAVWLRLSSPKLREDVRHLESAADGV